MRPNENNLGGALEINDHYLQMTKKIANVKSTVAAIRESRDYSAYTTGFSSRQTLPPSNLADRLSYNRRHRKESNNSEGDNHLRNIYHMNRRIENMYSVTERRKNPMDTSVHPATIRRARQNEVCRSVSQWKPQPKRSAAIRSSPERAPSRPATAPTARRERESYHRTTSYQPSPEQAYASASAHRYAELHTSDYNTFKRAIEDEIIDNRITSERGLKTLFRQYLKHNAAEHRETIRQVVEDLKVEWDVV
mmetsp:Transcript_42721/g.108061  ORF Transcript_42721/g.108061 Transcript_42721/m.108061 type:complete len:250 (+) Transcript_42721:287-1036(+)|eukprot:jgi/Tetstr1/437187/TSEL_002758.t1